MDINTYAARMDTLDYAVGLGGWIGFAFLVGKAIQGPIDISTIVLLPLITMFMTFIVLNIIKGFIYLLVWILALMFRADIFLVVFTVFMSGLLVFVIRSTIMMIHIANIDTVD